MNIDWKANTQPIISQKQPRYEISSCFCSLCFPLFQFPIFPLQFLNDSLCFLQFFNSLVSSVFQNEWVICRIFQKCSGGKKTHISGLVRESSFGNELRPSLLPPLMDSPPYNNSDTKTTTVGETSQVSCFSDPMEDQKTQDDIIDSFNNSHHINNSNSSHLLASSSSFPFKSSVQNSYFTNQIAPNTGNLQYPDSGLIQDQSILRLLTENHAPNMRRSSNYLEGPDVPSYSSAPNEFDSLWNY